MNSLVFIILRSAKNSFLELLKKPAKLILYLIIIISIVGVVLVSIFTKSLPGHTYQEMFWLKGIFFAFIMIFVVMSVQKGLTSGDSIFEMNDVNLLFVSPVNPKAILMYGLVRLTKVAFLSGFFILFQGSSLGNNFGVNFGGLVILLVVYMLDLILLSILSLFIYSVTNGKPQRKMVVRIISVAVFVPLALYGIIEFMNAGDTVTALKNIINSPLLTWIPAAGWASEAAIDILTGNTLSGLLFLGLILLASVLIVVYIAVSKSDYYEDVLCATETAFEKKRAVMEGNINAASKTNRNITVTKTGIGGSGASTLFGKHLRESFRENRFGFLGLSSFLMVLVSAAMAFFVPKGSVNCVMWLQILMWLQIFMVSTGRGLKELYMHYIFLIPESSFSKIIWSNMEVVFKTLIESILIFGIVGIIISDNVLVIIGSIIAYTLFSLLLLGINYLSMRWTDANISAGVLIMIYMFAVIVVMLPGVIGAIVLGFAIGGSIGAAAGLGILSVWELVAAFICFAFSKGVLHNCDMPVMRTGK